MTHKIICELSLTLSLNQTYKQSLTTEQKLYSQKKQILAENKRLQNKDYLGIYSRGKLYLTKDDEQVFVIKDKK